MRGFEPAFLTIRATRAPAKPCRANSAVAVLRILSRAWASFWRGRRTGAAPPLAPIVPSRSATARITNESVANKRTLQCLCEGEQGPIRAARPDNGKPKRTSIELHGRQRHLRQAGMSGDRVERQRRRVERTDLRRRC